MLDITTFVIILELISYLQSKTLGKPVQKEFELLLVDTSNKTKQEQNKYICFKIQLILATIFIPIS